MTEQFTEKQNIVEAILFDDELVKAFIEERFEDEEAIPSEVNIALCNESVFGILNTDKKTILINGAIAILGDYLVKTNRGLEVQSKDEFEKHYTRYNGLPKDVNSALKAIEVATPVIDYTMDRLKIENKDHFVDMSIDSAIQTALTALRIDDVQKNAEIQALTKLYDTVSSILNINSDTDKTVGENVDALIDNLEQAMKEEHPDVEELSSEQSAELIVDLMKHINCKQVIRNIDGEVPENTFDYFPEIMTETQSK